MFIICSIFNTQVLSSAHFCFLEPSLPVHEAFEPLCPPLHVGRGPEGLGVAKRHRAVQLRANLLELLLTVSMLLQLQPEGP